MYKPFFKSLYSYFAQTQSLSIIFVYHFHSCCIDGMFALAIKGLYTAYHQFDCFVIKTTYPSLRRAVKYASGWQKVMYRNQPWPNKYVFAALLISLPPENVRFTAFSSTATPTYRQLTSRTARFLYKLVQTFCWLPNGTLNKKVYN